MQKYKKIFISCAIFLIFLKKKKNARVPKPLCNLDVDPDMLTKFYCLFNTFFSSSISGKAFFKFSGISSDDL